MKQKVIAVDFDGCLCTNRWPMIGKANTGVIQALIYLRSRGTKIILWTCRTGALLEQAVAWCTRHGLRFDAVNHNLPEHVAQYGSDTRKVHADEYWDDRAVTVRCG